MTYANHHRVCFFKALRFRNAFTGQAGGWRGGLVAAEMSRQKPQAVGIFYICVRGGREWGRGATVCHMPPHFGLCKCCRWRRLRCAVDMARKSNRIIQFQYKDDDDKSQPKSTVDRERETRARRDKHERAQTGKGSLGNCIHKQIQFHVPHKKLISKSRAARQPAVAIYLLSSHLSPFPRMPFPPSWGKEK